MYARSKHGVNLKARYLLFARQASGWGQNADVCWYQLCDWLQQLKRFRACASRFDWNKTS